MLEEKRKRGENEGEGQRKKNEGKEDEEKDFAPSIDAFPIGRSERYILFLAVCVERSLKGVKRVVSSLIPVIRFPLNGFAMVCTRAILAGVER